MGGLWNLLVSTSHVEVFRHVSQEHVWRSTTPLVRVSLKTPSSHGIMTFYETNWESLPSASNMLWSVAMLYPYPADERARGWRIWCQLKFSMFAMKADYWVRACTQIECRIRTYVHKHHTCARRFPQRDRRSMHSHHSDDPRNSQERSDQVLYSLVIRIDCCVRGGLRPLGSCLQPLHSTPKPY